MISEAKRFTGVNFLLESSAKRLTARNLLSPTEIGYSFHCFASETVLIPAPVHVRHSHDNLQDDQPSGGGWGLTQYSREKALFIDNCNILRAGVMCVLKYKHTKSPR